MPHAHPKREPYRGRDLRRSRLSPGSVVRKWLARGGYALVAIFALVLLFSGFVMLYANEGRVVGLSRALADVRADRILELDSLRVAPPEDGTLVYLTGKITTDGRAHDDVSGGFAATLLRLTRQVEMFQWREECRGKGCSRLLYTKDWIGIPVDSSTFHFPKYRNPDMPFTSTSIDVEVRLAGYPVDPEMLTDLLADLPARPVMPDALPAGYRKVGDALYRSKDPDHPKIGDLRISYSGIFQPTSTMSLVAIWQSGMLQPLYTQDHAKLAMIVPEAVPPEDIVQTRRQRDAMTIWIFRVAGVASLFAGFALLRLVLARLPYRPRYAAGMLDAPVWRTAAILTVTVAFLAVALAWIGDRPLIGVGLLLAAIVFAALTRPRQRWAG